MKYVPIHETQDTITPSSFDILISCKAAGQSYTEACRMLANPIGGIAITYYEDSNGKEHKMVKQVIEKLVIGWTRQNYKKSMVVALMAMIAKYTMARPHMIERLSEE